MDGRRGRPTPRWATKNVVFAVIGAQEVALYLGPHPERKEARRAMAPWGPRGAFFETPAPEFSRPKVSGRPGVLGLGKERRSNPLPMVKGVLIHWEWTKDTDRDAK
jgi:hypothetical protein